MFSAIAMAVKLPKFVACSVHVDGLMISVERIFQYIEGIDHEPSQEHGGSTRCAHILT
jgi:hypothetical protein